MVEVEKKSGRTSEKILDYISKNGHVSGKMLSDHFAEITPRAIRKQLKNLLEAGTLQKTGRPPKVFYFVPTLNVSVHDTLVTSDAAEAHTDAKTREIIGERYLYISPSGDMRFGWDGFVLWCEKTKQDVAKTAIEYVFTLQKYDTFVKDGLIDGMRKMSDTFHDAVFLDRLFYIDFYSIERFGKTRIGQILLHAKNSQDKRLIKVLADEIRPRVLALIKKYEIDGVLFVPPTIKRETQLMKELEKGLKLPVRTLAVTKVKTQIAVAQKTLAKLSDRVENARKTIIVEDAGRYNNILIIDDAVGSGSTLNETAAQIKKKGLCTGKVVGLAIAGSFKGFDVISEV